MSCEPRFVATGHHDQSGPSEESGSGQPAFSLVVLVRQMDRSRVSARAANLALEPVTAGTVRNALRELVRQAKQALASAEDSQASLWRDTPLEPEQGENQFQIPFHL